MPRRHTRVLTVDRAGIDVAAAILRHGGLVAFPTETVYGLGAHALDAQAVRGIFEAKQRPADDPVIVHLADASQLERVAVPNNLAWRLADQFWPGPLTLVLPKTFVVPLDVTAGLASVGVRVPSHPVANALLAASELPVAAPSANLFGRPSPTLAEHVLSDLDGRIDAVLDGGPASIGVESTIVDLTSDPPRLLRPGGIALEDIEQALGVRITPIAPKLVGLGPQPAPGMLPVHYSPRTALTLIVGPPSEARERLIAEVDAALGRGQRVGVIALEEDVEQLPAGARTKVVGSWSDPQRSAARLFQAMRTLDADGLHVLFARELSDPSVGLGRALADRLRRASRRVLDTRE